MDVCEQCGDAGARCAVGAAVRLLCPQHARELGASRVPCVTRTVDDLSALGVRLELHSGFSDGFVPFPLHSPEPGWNDVVAELFIDLARAGWRRMVVCIQEKYGGLRVDLLGLSDTMSTRVCAAMAQAEATCCRCGDAGSAGENPTGSGCVFCGWCDPRRRPD